jgi:hypothetical protein
LRRGRAEPAEGRRVCSKDYPNPKALAGCIRSIAGMFWMNEAAVPRQP